MRQWHAKIPSVYTAMRRRLCGPVVYVRHFLVSIWRADESGRLNLGTHWRVGEGGTVGGAPEVLVPTAMTIQTQRLSTFVRMPCPTR
jgi:hypothetical protein